MTSKLQVTVPKAIADQYGIRPGDEITWVAGAESIQVLPARSVAAETDTETRLRLFHEATKRQRARNKVAEPTARTRGWTREELYDRGSSR